MRLGATDIAGFRLGLSAVSRLYLGAALVWQDEALPPAGITATTLFPGGAGTIDAVSETAVTIGRLAALPTPDGSGTGAFRTVARLDNYEGIRPAVDMLGQTNTQWSHTTATTNAAMAYMPDPAGETILVGPITSVAGGVRSQPPTNITIPQMFVGIQPYYFLARKAAVRAAWLANPLVSPGPGTDANAVFAVADGVPDPTPGRDFNAPAMPLYCYRIGSGAYHVLFADGNHPNEWLSGYTMEGMVDFLLSADPVAVALRENCTFTIYDDLNPFGRFYGVARAQPQIIGGNVRDSNRSWGIPEPAQVISLHMAHMLSHKPATGYSLVVDCHCHGNFASTKTNGWATYGTQSLGAGRTNVNSSFITYLTAAGSSAHLLNTTLEGQLRVWGQGNLGGVAAAAISAEITNRGFPIQGRAWGERIMRALNSAINNGLFAANLPVDPPPPPDPDPEWNVVYGDGTATVISHPPLPTGPEWEVVYGDATATASSWPGLPDPSPE